MSTSLPIQRLPFNSKNDQWKKETVDYLERMSYTSGASNRSTNYDKKINYDLFNGKFNKADLEYVCNPLGLAYGDNELPATMQHMDILSPAFNLLISDEATRADNSIVISESPLDINRKQKATKDKLMATLQQHLMSEIDPKTVDPNNPPPTPDQVLKYDKYNISDLIESKSNKLLKHLKKYLNVKEIYKKGWKDVLVAGEEIYWTGVSNNEVIFRRCNPLNTTVILDGDTDYIDDALSVVEVRLLAPATILDELGEDLKPDDVKELEALAKRYTNYYGNQNNIQQFALNVDGNGQLGVGDTGIGNYSSTNTMGSYNSDLIRVVRVEWKSFKKLFYLTYIDENDEEQSMMVDESFKLSTFKDIYPKAKTEEFWINEAWEGIKIGQDIYVNVQPKPNQRRRMDNPYYCKLGYTGLIYNATNSRSVSLMDRLKPYQYLYNIISYRLELAFASDQGKIMLMDLAQIPRSEGIDIEKWMYYLKAMKIGFINSFEESRKGSTIGQRPTFNQFQSIDLSMANTINQYIETLNYIRQQTAFISGVSPQRLGAIENRELVGNVEKSIQQSALITEYLFDSHDDVKRRVYTALVECAKIAYKDGKKIQYILDDMGIEMLELEEGEFDDSEFNVFISNSTKDRQIVESLKQLMNIAVQHDKADLSTMIDSLINDSPRDILRTIKRAEEEKYARDKAAQDSQNQIQQQTNNIAKQTLDTNTDLKNRELDIKQYEIDSNNQTRIEVAEIGTYNKVGPLDENNDGIPDPIEIGKLALDRQDLEQKAFLEQSKLKHDKDKHDKELAIKDKELKIKESVENKKIEQTRIQNQNQIELANKKAALDEKLANKKIELEKIKARNKPKPKK